MDPNEQKVTQNHTETKADAPKTEDPKSFKDWLISNRNPIIALLLAIGFIIYRKLDPLDIAKVVFGLGLVVFIHELGHFLAAKWCDVHVKTFSIGFGKPLPLPFCKFKYGETTYKIGWIPLGGFVHMVGENEGENEDDDEDDPRSLTKKTVWQRMLIISAGVIMNLILGSICFIVAYSHGVEEMPAIVGGSSPGGAAWEAGLPSDIRIVEIDGVKDPSFDDIKPRVISAAKDTAIPFKYIDRNGTVSEMNIVPKRDEGMLYPLVGIGPVNQLTLEKKGKNIPIRPFRPNSPAAEAKATDGKGFQPLDRIIACTDPNKNNEVTELPPDPWDPQSGKLDYVAFLDRVWALRGQPLTVRVQSTDGSTREMTLKPAYHSVIPGLHLRMGKIMSIRKGSSAESAKPLEEGKPIGLQTAKKEEPDSGDQIVAAEVTMKDGKKMRWTTQLGKEKDSVQEERLDPFRLPFDLDNWAREATDRTVILSVLRQGGLTPSVVKYQLEYDPKWPQNRETTYPYMPISGLGIAYSIQAIVDDVDAGSVAEKAGFQKDDILTSVVYTDYDLNDNPKESPPRKFEESRGTLLYSLLQDTPIKDYTFTVKRFDKSKNETVELPIKVSAVPADGIQSNVRVWPSHDLGFHFKSDTRLHKAEGILDALGLGIHRTKRMIVMIYQTLYATLFRQISVKTISGPLTIANVSYKIAGEDIWAFLIFIGLINVNLAVVNFLPIPVLDGGHMVFLIYEKIFGVPPPNRVVVIASIIGLVMIISLMLFSVSMDIWNMWIK